MNLYILQVFVLFDRVLCSSSIEYRGAIVLTGPERVVPFPLIFIGTNAVVLPSTTFKDLKKGTEEERKIEAFINNISHMVLSFLVADPCYEEDSRVQIIFDRDMEGHLRDVSENAWKIYKRGKTFSELLPMVCDRMLQCDEKEESRKMSIFGKNLIKEADKIMGEISDEIDKEKRYEKECFCARAKDAGEKHCDVEKLKKLIVLEELVCNTCKNLYTNLKEEELLGLMAEGCVRKIFKEEGLSEEEMKNRIYMEYCIIDGELFLHTYDRYGEEVIEELVKQLLAGKDGREIDSKYVDKVIEVVNQRKKRIEEEADRYANELMALEEAQNQKGQRVQGKKRQRRKKRSEVGKKEESEEVEKESSDEELIGAVGGICIEKKKRERKSPYEIHKRVLLWRKSPELVKKTLDEGKEKRWKGRNIDDIKRQKDVHDILEVTQLLKDEDADKFFMDGGTFTKDNVERGRKIAIAILEVKGKRRVGVVEVGTFKDPKGCNVVYHLMFRDANIREIGGVMDQRLYRRDDLENITETDSLEHFSDISGFQYPQGTRCEVTKNEREFCVTWGCPSDTAKVLKRLTVVRRLETV